MSNLEHWKKMKDPNFLGSWDLLTGADDNGLPQYGEISVTISSTGAEQVMDLQTNSKKSVPVCHFTENYKPMILNSTNMKAIEKATRTPLTNYWNGKSITIYVDKVKAFGAIHDALRVRPFAPKQAITYTCSCGATIPENTAIRTQKAFGIKLCADCGNKKRKEKEEIKE